MTKLHHSHLETRGTSSSSPRTDEHKGKRVVSPEFSDVPADNDSSASSSLSASTRRPTKTRRSQKASRKVNESTTEAALANEDDQVVQKKKKQQSDTKKKTALKAKQQHKEEVETDAEDDDGDHSDTPTEDDDDDHMASAPRTKTNNNKKKKCKKIESKKKSKSSKRKKTVVDDPLFVPERVYVPRATDILLGRGNGAARFPGNRMYRAIVAKYKQAYCVLPPQQRAQKLQVCRQVMQELAVYGGRFLEEVKAVEGKDGGAGEGEGRSYYVTISEWRAYEKTCQALREKKNGFPSEGVVSLASSLVKQEGNDRKETNRSKPGSAALVATPKAKAPKKQEATQAATTLKGTPKTTLPSKVVVTPTALTISKTKKETITNKKASTPPVPSSPKKGGKQRDAVHKTKKASSSCSKSRRYRSDTRRHRTKPAVAVTPSSHLLSEGDQDPDKETINHEDRLTPVAPKHDLLLQDHEEEEDEESEEEEEEKENEEDDHDEKEEASITDEIKAPRSPSLLLPPLLERKSTTTAGGAGIEDILASVPPPFESLYSGSLLGHCAAMMTARSSTTTKNLAAPSRCNLFAMADLSPILDPTHGVNNNHHHHHHQCSKSLDALSPVRLIWNNFDSMNEDVLVDALLECEDDRHGIVPSPPPMPLLSMQSSDFNAFACTLSKKQRNNDMDLFPPMLSSFLSDTWGSASQLPPFAGTSTAEDYSSAEATMPPITSFSQVSDSSVGGSASKFPRSSTSDSREVCCHCGGVKNGAPSMEWLGITPPLSPLISPQSKRKTTITSSTITTMEPATNLKRKYSLIDDDDEDDNEDKEENSTLRPRNLFEAWSWASV